jgi:ATP-dependent DNA helicase RecG
MKKEDQHVEWKESWRDEYLKWISGFANSEGGVLIIGMNDQGKAVGLPDAHKLLVDLPNKVRDVLGILVDVNLKRSGRNEYLEIVVEPYPYPVSYKGEYHIRSGSTKQELKGAALDKFLLRKVGRHWDGLPLPHLAVKDLSRPAINTFRDLARQSQRMDSATLKQSAPALIEKLHLLDGAYLKRAAALLFHPDPERFFTGAFVKIGYFRTNADLLYHDEIHGDLFTQVQRTMDLLLTKYLTAGINYRGVQRVETYPVPEAALREAVLNAVVHKDYATGTPIQISVYQDKLMLWNAGELPPDWTVAKLKGKHSSRPFNPDVANAFFRAGMIEAWGRGIELILEACRAAHTPEPELRCEQAGLWVTFHFPAASEAETRVETPVKTRVETPQRILELLRASPEMTLAEVAVVIGKSLSAVERASAKLVKDARLRYVGPRKGGHWEVLK